MAVIPRISTSDPRVKSSLAVALDVVTRDGLPLLDTPEFTEYQNALAAYRASVRRPIREKLKRFAANFEFPEGVRCSGLLDAYRRERNAARRAYEAGVFKTFSLSQQIDAAARLELAEGTFDIVLKAWLEVYFGAGLTKEGVNQWFDRRWIERHAAVREHEPWREDYANEDHKKLKRRIGHAET